MIQTVFILVIITPEENAVLNAVCCGNHLIVISTVILQQ